MGLQPLLARASFLSAFMKRLALILVLSLLSLVLTLPTLAQDTQTTDVHCAGSLEPHLHVGDTGRIAHVFSTLRSSPAGMPIRVMFSPATFQVLEGPLCAGYGPLTWYRIQYENGATGWASESQVWSRWGFNLYWLESAEPTTFNPQVPVNTPPTQTQQPGTQATIKITEPQADAVIDTSAPITIQGNGGGLIDGKVVVRLVDDQSNVLAEQSTTLDDAGNWQTSIPLSVTDGTHGVIVAYSPSEQTGSVSTLDIINVTFGIPTREPNFVKIGTPQEGTGVQLDQQLLISGVADPRNGNLVRVQIVDEHNNLLLQQPVDIVPSSQGDFGTWGVTIELRGQAVGTQLQISAQTVTSFEGDALATDTVGVLVTS